LGGKGEGDGFSMCAGMTMLSWIPASAGMTEKRKGETEKRKGATKKGSGDTRIA